MGEFICVDDDKPFILTIGGQQYISYGDQYSTNGQVYFNISGSTGNIGRIYNELQIVAIDNQEFLASLNTNSNRSFQFPDMGARLITNKNNGVLKPNQCIWLSYILTSNVYREYLPSQNIIRVQNTTLVNKDIEFNFGDLTGLDLDFNSLKLVYQVTDDCSKPSPCNWKQVDFSEDIMNGNNVDLNLASDKTDYVLNNFKFLTSSNFKLSYLNNIDSGCSQKINANFEFYSARELFKSVFNIKVDGSKLNSSKNCTYSSGDNVVLSEIGIFNTNKDLVMISKLTNPIVVNKSSLYTLEVNIDF